MAEIEVSVPPAATVEIGPRTSASLSIAAAGPQGPPGLQNVHVGPTPPLDPVVNMVWIQTFE